LAEDLHCTFSEKTALCMEQFIVTHEGPACSSSAKQSLMTLLEQRHSAAI
jgi:hypothetical protein